MMGKCEQLGGFLGELVGEGCGFGGEFLGLGLEEFFLLRQLVHFICGFL